MVDHDRLVALFEAACDLDPASRSEFVTRECAGDDELRGELEALLTHDHGAAQLTVAPQQSTAGDLEAPVTIGPYRILREVGRGGMAEVYEAAQDAPVRRTVALKLIKPGMDTREVVARFNSERQALALMNHPNIARVFDAGATPAGRPFFAMEYVKGIPIHDYCDQERLSIAERLRLFQQVCRGVQHAHQKGVIHRDLKPSNILVKFQDGEAMPKIIDFGVAKATHHPLDGEARTRIGLVIGTPEYMSPEQTATTALDVDTRSDVYSLGVVLYELLCGRVPFEQEGASLEEILTKVRELEPERPSSLVARLTDDSVAAMRATERSGLARRLRGDLDWIVLKALDKERTRRYDSANELAGDIERHLTFETVQARPPDLRYRAGRFLRRNRAGVVFAGALLLLLIGFASVLIVQAQGLAEARDRAQREATRASQEAAAARQVSDFLVDAFRVAEADSGEIETVTVADVLSRGLLTVERGFSEEPLAAARLMDALGRANQNLGRFDEAERALRRALNLRAEEGGTDSVAYLESAVNIARLFHDQDRLDEAETHYRLAIDGFKRTLGTEHPLYAQALHQMGRLQVRKENYDEAEGLYDEAVRLQEQHLGLDHLDLAETLRSQSVLMRRRDRLPEAEVAVKRSIELLERALGPTDVRVVRGLRTLAVILTVQKRHVEAEEVYRRCLRILEAVSGPNHPDVATTINNLAVVYREMGRDEEARTLLERSLQIKEGLLGREHLDVAVVLVNLAMVNLSTGDVQAAEEQATRALGIAEGERAPRIVAEALTPLAGARLAAGRVVEAAPLYERALSIFEETAGAEHADTAYAVEGLARVYWRLDRHELAGDYFERALAIRSRGGADNPELVRLKRDYEEFLRQTARRGDGELSTRPMD